MNEIEKRIATTWPGRPTTADVEATRLADLRAVKAEIERLAGVIDVQADITGQLGASFHALSARVAALEKRTESVGHDAGSTGQRPVGEANEPRLPCAPPAPLVERMAEAFRKACIPAAFDIVSASEDGARAVLLVAAEELLGPVTTAEREEFGFGNIATINRVDHVLRARLAAALEACR